MRRIRRLPSSRSVKAITYRAVLMRLPMRRGSAVFESGLGRAFTDSPKYLYLALRASGDRRRVVWSYLDDPNGFPSDAVLVRRGSWRYLLELARAEFWVDDQGFPAIARRRRATTYLQTWHGSAYKTMGFDQPELRDAGHDRRQAFAAAVGRWTHLCVQSETAEQTFAAAFRHKAQVLRTGYPRNDPLLAPDVQSRKAEHRRSLGLPTDRLVVLYAPTFRDWDRGADGTARLDLARIAADIGERCLILVRAHYLDRPAETDAFPEIARDVSTHADVTELLLAADALITDYSSVMFDFALLRRPMLFYAPDLEVYNRRRGSYFDLQVVAPGPVVQDMDEVVGWLRQPQAAHDSYSERYDAFVRRFCGFEHGDAAERVRHSVFGTAR
jgi:CDP-glycerol glycerophosphotransferase